MAGRRGFVALALALLPRGALGGDAIRYAYLEVQSPASAEWAEEAHLGLLAAFSEQPVEGELMLWVPSDELGCDEDAGPAADYSALSTETVGFVSLVRRGTCTFVTKTQVAQRSGAKGVIVINDNETFFSMGDPNHTGEVDIFSVMVDHEFGEQLRNASLAAQGGSVPEAGVPRVSVVVPDTSLLNISEFFLISFATFLVALGAFFATSDMKEVHTRESISAALAPPEEEVLEVDQPLALTFCVVGSCFLVFLFFLMRYAIYFIIFAFCMGGLQCITNFGSILLGHLFPGMKKKKCIDIPQFGPVSTVEAIAAVPAVAIVACWFFLRNTQYGWPFQDIIGAGFLCQLQRTLRLPNIKTATLLLSCMFFFDIFWVFISPIFFHESVMVSVAKGGGTGESVPMLLRIPAFGGKYASDRLLGFGDIALPGLLVSYLRRHDLMSKRPFCQGYFLPSLIGYFIGLNVTIAALCIMQMGQPALLYLVPGTLGTTLVLSSCRGDLSYLWEGVASPEPSSEDESKESLSGDYNGV